MTFDDLLEWFDDALPRLSRVKMRAETRRHLLSMHGILLRSDHPERFPREWKKLAAKVAERLGQEPPAVAKFDKSKRPRRVPSPSAATRPRRRAVRPPRLRLEMNPQLEAAFAAIEKRKPIVFVTGGAGTGKSTFIRELRERFPRRNSVVLAPTGVAALTAGGQTIHSFCRLPLRPVTGHDVVEIDEPEIVRELDLVIIDEISMVRADVFDGMERFLRINRQSNEPFGGVQVVLVGDLFQLPPVVTRADMPFIERDYDTPHFFSAKALKGLSFFPVELEITYRQKDAGFASLLRDLRDSTNIDEAIAEINNRCVGRRLDGQHLILVPTRKAAAEENDRRLAALPGKKKIYTAKVEGTFSRDDDRLPAPQALVLKRGAQVMFVRNDYPRKRWVNGTLGTVEELSNDSILIRSSTEEVHEVQPIEWQNLRYAWDRKEKKIVEEILGTFVQFPIIPAWSVTIHKAQGLTLSRVAVDLGRGAFADGQVYVALSRCQTLSGLSLTRAVRPHEVRCSTAAADFYAKLRRRVDATDLSRQ